MKNIDGYFYLHTNGELIYKKYIDGGQLADFRESPFVRCFWSIDPKNRLDAWTILVEALSVGANKKRVFELADKWKCNDTDAQKYAEVVGFQLSKDGNSWSATRNDFVNLQESPAGFGDTCLEAISQLCAELGYKPQKLWGNDFKGLLTGTKEASQ